MPPKALNIEIELELTYLARKIPGELNGVTPQRLVDTYVPENAAKPYVRLRQKGTQYEITKKQPVDESDFSHQTEQTIPLKKDEFDALCKASRRRVEKDRYMITVEGRTAEVDVFDGELKGLVVIDFEFGSLEEKQAFKPPEFCLVEVTQELFIAGGQLAGKTYDDIAADLARFNYQPLGKGV
ncbi:MAG TPA: hypothetical protein VK712_04290 [Verrucomicrobiae bacterium]|jgi:adenylate cyclase|nr:hypothetical protein [Verrucomicrobiae bacterium]